LKITNKVSKDEYEKIKNIRRGPSHSALHKSNKESDFLRVHNEAKQTLRDIQGFVSNQLFTGDVSASIISIGNTRSDVDNITKAALDSAQGIIYSNDKQVWKIHAERRV